MDPFPDIPQDILQDILQDISPQDIPSQDIPSQEDIEFDYSYFLPEGIADDDDDSKFTMKSMSPGIRLNPNATEFKEKVFKPMEYNYSNFTPNFLLRNNNTASINQQQLFVQQQNALKLSTMKNYNNNATANLEIFNPTRNIGLGSAALNTPNTLARKPPIAPSGNNTYLNNNNIQNQLTNFMVQLQTNQINNYSPNVGNMSPGISPGFGTFGSNPYNNQPNSPAISDNTPIISAASVFDSIASLQLRNQDSISSQSLPFNSYNHHGNMLTVPSTNDSKFPVAVSNRRLSTNTKKDFTSFADMAASSSKSEVTKVDSRKSFDSNKGVEVPFVNSGQSTYASFIKSDPKPDTPKIENKIETIKVDFVKPETKVESKIDAPKSEIVVLDNSLKSRKNPRQSPTINTQSVVQISQPQVLSPVAFALSSLNSPLNKTPVEDNDGLIVVKFEKSRSITEKHVEKKEITIGGSYNALETINPIISSSPPSPVAEHRKSANEVHEISQAAINRKIKNNLRLEKEKEKERDKENKKHQQAAKAVIKEEPLKPVVDDSKLTTEVSSKKDDIFALGTLMLILATFASTFFNSANLKKFIAATLKYFTMLYSRTFSNDSPFWSRFIAPATSYIFSYFLIVLDFHHSTLKIGYSDKQRLICFCFLYAFPFLHAYNVSLCMFPPWAVSFSFCLFLMVSFYFGATNNSVITTLIKSSLPLYLIFHVSSESMLNDFNPGLRLTLAFLISAVRKYDISRPMLLAFTCFELLISVSLGHLFIAQWTILLGSMQMFRYLDL